MFLSQKDSVSEMKYKFYKNKLTNILRHAETQYYSHKLTTVKGDIRNTWKVLKNVINKNVTKVSPHSTFNHAGSKITSNSHIANLFNEYFVNVVPSLAKNIDFVNKDPTEYLKGNYPKSMFLHETDEDEIFNVIMKQKSNKATGFDDISVDVVKYTADFYANHYRIFSILH